MTAMLTEVSDRLSPRAELAQLTRARVLDAMAEILRRGGEATFDQIARESRIPQRTLYRHFENKEALFAAFWVWVNNAIEMPPIPRTPDAVVSHIPALFAAFDRDEALVRAMMHAPHGRAVRLANAEARRAKFREALAPVLGPLGTAMSTRLLASITAICSASGWETMKDNWQLSGAEAADAAQWAVNSLIESARIAAAAPSVGSHTPTHFSETGDPQP